MAHRDDHGNSVAGWTLALGELAAAALLGYGLAVRETAWIWAGVILAVIVLVIWKVLVAAGLGDPEHLGPPIVPAAGERGLAADVRPRETTEAGGAGTTAAQDAPRHPGHAAPVAGGATAEGAR